MIVLALDTALELCSVAVLQDGAARAVRSEPMARGHQERLAPMVAEVMAEAGLDFAALHRIGVTVGPGSFTGLRVGLAFAKGLGAALSRPVVGVGTLQALAADDPAPGATVAVIDARRGQAYLQAFESGRPLAPPEALALADAPARLAGLRVRRLAGPGAPLLAAAFPEAQVDAIGGPDPLALARLVEAAPWPDGPPRPVYLRAPDAKLPGGVDP